MKESNMPRADFITSIILVVFGIFVIWASLAMPRFEDQGGNFYDAPGVVPFIIGVLVTALSLVMLVRAIKRKGYRFDSIGSGIGAVLRSEGTLRIGVTIAICVLYGLVLLRLLHFIGATLIFVFAFVMIFEYDPKKSPGAQWKVPFFAVILAVASTAAVYGVFQYLFLVNLP